MAALRVLVVTKGHPFEVTPFFAIFDADEDLVWSHAEHPQAQRWFRSAHAGTWDAIVCYDMPGIEFRPGGVELIEPPPDYVDGFLALLAAGQGIVFLHHALAGWPAWEEYGRIIGGRFHYCPGHFGGREWPDSGYRFDVDHHVSCITPDHPVCAGLDEGFDLSDELYLAPVLEDEVVPLLRSDADFRAGGFSSAALAVQGRMHDNRGWDHPAGSSLVGWARAVGRSPIVYLQPGDGPTTYGNAAYRRLVGNAIRWVASDEAHSWARA